MFITPIIETTKVCKGFNLSLSTEEMAILKSALGRISQSQARSAGYSVSVQILYDTLETALKNENIPSPNL